jgi:hypothetical protein
MHLVDVIEMLERQKAEHGNLPVYAAHEPGIDARIGEIDGVRVLELVPSAFVEQPEPDPMTGAKIERSHQAAITAANAIEGEQPEPISISEHLAKMMPDTLQE